MTLKLLHSLPLLWSNVENQPTKKVSNLYFTNKVTVFKGDKEIIKANMLPCSRHLKRDLLGNHMQILIVSAASQETSTIVNSDIGLI